jgi:hypothetical protein
VDHANTIHVHAACPTTICEDVAEYVPVTAVTKKPIFVTTAAGRKAIFVYRSSREAFFTLVCWNG